MGVNEMTSALDDVIVSTRKRFPAISTLDSILRSVPGSFIRFQKLTKMSNNDGAIDPTVRTLVGASLSSADI